MLKRDIKTHQDSNGGGKNTPSPNRPCISQLMYPSVVSGEIKNSMEVFLKCAVARNHLTLT